MFAMESQAIHFFVALFGHDGNNFNVTYEPSINIRLVKSTFTRCYGSLMEFNLNRSDALLCLLGACEFNVKPNEERKSISGTGLLVNSP